MAQEMVQLILLWPNPPSVEGGDHPNSTTPQAMKPMDPDSDDGPFTEFVSDAMITNYVAVSFVTILWYDHLLTFGQEVELIWKASRWKSFMKLVYIWNRYVHSIMITALAVARVIRITHDSTCNTHYEMEGAASLMVFIVADFILVLRIWILYDRDQRIMYFFIFLIILEFITLLLLDTVFLRSYQIIIRTSYPLPGCHIHQLPRTMALGTLPPIIMSSIMFGLTLYKCIQNFRLGVAIRMPLMSRFFRDGIIWYFGVLVVLGACGINWVAGRRTLADLFNIPNLVVFVTIVSRVLLNIRELTSKKPPPADEHSLDTVPSIVFRPLELLPTEKTSLLDGFDMDSV